MENAYGLFLRAQEDMIDKYCFGECKKILVAFVSILGETFMLCNQQECKYKELDEDLKYKFDCYGFLNCNLVIRKLKEESHE